MSAVQLSISNIGFPPAALDEALALLRELNVPALEIAPYNIFGRWDVQDADIDALRMKLDSAGIACPSLQGILHQTGSAHLFQSRDTRRAMREHLTQVARMAGRLGAHACVFGAPRLRDPGELSAADAFSIAATFLQELGPIFAAEGTVLAVEPNASAYKCRFVTTTADAMTLVDAVDTAGIGLQIDTGAVFLENEDPAVLARAARYAVHAHVSEPMLAPIGTSAVDHAPLAQAIRAGGYAGSLSIEMRSVPDWQAAIRAATTFVRETYLQ